MNSGRASSVAVVGAGAAGLATAYWLNRGGADPAIFESEDRAGGRVYARSMSGYTLDLGAQVMYRGYRVALRLCRDLGLEVVGFDPTARIYWRGRLATESQVLDTWRKRVRIAGLRLGLLFGGPRRGGLDEISFAQYAYENFGKELLEDLFQPFTAGLVHAGPEAISANCGLAYLRLASGGTCTVKTGMGSLANALAGRVRSLHLGSRVIRVVLNGNKVDGVEVNREGRTEFVASRTVLVAVPAPVAATLVPEAPESVRGFLAATRYSSSVHVLFATDRPLAARVYAILVPSSSGSRLACILEDARKHSAFVPRGAGLSHAIVHGPSAAAMLDAGADGAAEAAASEVRRVAPEFTKTHRFYQMQCWRHSVCLSAPGHAARLDRFREALRDIDGLYFAGDFMGIPSVEGALRSGKEAAEAILRRIRA